MNINKLLELTKIPSENIKDLLEALIQKEIVEEVIINNEIQYQLTDLGILVAPHMWSDPKTRS